MTTGSKKVRGKVTLVADPNAIPIRAAAPRVVYPEGSIRAQRQALLEQEKVVRASLADCEHCKAIRAEAHRLMNEAEDLFMASIEEAHEAQGRVKTKRVVYAKPPEEVAE
jgi:hypothetical protein